MRGVVLNLPIIIPCIEGYEFGQLVDLEFLMQIASGTESVIGDRWGGGLAHPLGAHNGNVSVHFGDVPVVVTVLVESIILLASAANPSIATIVGNALILLAKPAIDRDRELGTDPLEGHSPGQGQRGRGRTTFQQHGRERRSLSVTEFAAAHILG